MLHLDLSKGSGDALTGGRSRSWGLEHPSGEEGKGMLRSTGNLQVKLPAPSVCVARKSLGCKTLGKKIQRNLWSSSCETIY